jgi:hypothetical protein
LIQVEGRGVPALAGRCWCEICVVIDLLRTERLSLRLSVGKCGNYDEKKPDSVRAICVRHRHRIRERKLKQMNWGIQGGNHKWWRCEKVNPS